MINLEAKDDLQLLREQLQGARDDLMFMNKYAGDSVAIDANIRHKREQIRDLEERIRKLEGQDENRV